MAVKKMTKTITTPVEDNIEEKITYEPTDTIPCRSITSGVLFVTGVRSNITYQFADFDDIVDIEYRDLVYMVRSNDKAIFEPRFIIEDESFVNENKRLADLYASLYSVGDFKEILNLPTFQMSEAIKALPYGAKEAIKGIISTMIDNHSIDSVTKIKALDEIFGTKMLLTLAES